MRITLGPVLQSVIAIALIASNSHPAQGSSVAIYNLDVLGTGTRSVGYGVNDSGQVAGISGIGGSAFRAFRFDPSPILRDLGVLGGSGSEGDAINKSGQVAGWSQTSGGPNHAIRYDGTPGAGGIMRDLGSLSPSSSSYGYGINGAGQVTGYSDVSISSSHAFRYDGTPGAGGIMRDLGTLPGYQSSDGRAINATGQVAGSCQTSVTNRAFRYDGTPGAGGIMRDLGTLWPSGDSAACGINASGQVTGNSDVSFQLAHAFRYDGTPGAGGVMHDLGTLGGSVSQGDAINDAGFVVGYAYGSSGQRATVWRPDLSIVNLDAWVDLANPAEGAHWSLFEAFGVSNTGFVTGYGDYNDGPGGLSDGERAFLLDASGLIPEPSALAFAITGTVTLIRRRR